MRLVSLVNLCTLHVSLISKLKKEFFGWFFGENIVTWKSKKQRVVARSNAEAEYRAMDFELIWLKTLLSELGVEVSHPMRIFFVQSSSNSHESGFP